MRTLLRKLFIVNAIIFFTVVVTFLVAIIIDITTAFDFGFDYEDLKTSLIIVAIGIGIIFYSKIVDYFIHKDR